MPTVPRQTKCSTLGCKNERSKMSQFCTDHGGYDAPKQKFSEDRYAFNSMYAQASWRKFRQTQLSRHPLCQACLIQGHIRSATEVDHLFSWSHIGKQAFWANTFQNLCPTCHAEKTKLEKKGIYRHYSPKEGVPTVDYRLNEYQRVCFGDSLTHQPAEP